MQPLLGTAEPATDYTGAPINFHMGQMAGQQINGAVAWHEATTENPALGATEVWEIYNTTPDAHPVHLHLVHFDILDRQKFKADVLPQPVVQHNGAVGTAFSLANIKLQGKASPPAGVEVAPKDMVTAYPGEVTRIKATFDKPGRYVWHCHILSHEDHEMMRVLHVGPGA
jgi:FtsP/CotA-like multicopper oxidase with cupredoxin domain